VHRVIDYGSHGMVDVDLADGFRLKAMVPDPDDFRPGQGVDLAPARVTLYRHDQRVWRS
jgi:putative spermidine/putrescine transport system ATP-binding protein